MKKHGWTVILVVVVSLLLLVYSVAYIVDFRQCAIVKTFGKAGEPIDGKTQAGLHWKWPWPIQSLVRYEKTNYIFEDALDEITTRDRLTLMLADSCTWNISRPDLFVRSLETPERAEQTLRDALRSIKSRVASGHDMSEFVNVDQNKVQLGKMEDDMRAALNEQAQQYGISIVHVGVKDQGLTPTVTQGVIENEKQERERIANVYREQGKSVADAIRSRAEQARRQILAFADKKAQLIKSEGEAEAGKYYDRFRQNEQFAVYLRELEFMREALKNNSVFVLDRNSARAIGFLSGPVTLPPAASQPAAPAATPVSATQPAARVSAEK